MQFPDETSVAESQATRTGQAVKEAQKDKEKRDVCYSSSFVSDVAVNDNRVLIVASLQGKYFMSFPLARFL
jgi:hypothetical protein